MEVLNRDTGRFTVPQNADGLYLFTFSITMDTWDFIEGHTWDFYYFRKNGRKILGSELYGDAGSNEDHDKLPGSRTILVELNAGDSIDVFQQKKRDIPDRQASFCGSLIHLRKVLAVFSKVLSTFLINIFRSARTSCTTFGWSVRPFVRPVRKKNLDHLYTGIYAL